jgi:hypothetical protein
VQRFLESRDFHSVNEKADFSDSLAKVSRYLPTIRVKKIRPHFLKFTGIGPRLEIGNF